MSFLRLEPLIPYEEAVSEVPPGDLVDIEGQSVYVKDVGSGPVIVMLHGLASSSYSYRMLIDNLSAKFRLVAIDLNGFGLTQRPKKAKAYRIERQADLIARVLQKKSLGKVVMLGHSYGAAVSAVMAAMHPELISKVVLISPPSEFSEKPPWYVRNPIGTRFAYFLIRALLSNPDKFHELSVKAFHVDGVMTGEAAEVYRRMMLVEGLKNACIGYAKAFGSNGADAIRYENISQPTLLIAGDEDAVVSVKSCIEVSKKVSDCRLVILSGCGHCPPEEFPEEVGREVMAFVAQA